MRHMKNKLLYLGCAVLILLLAVIGVRAETDSGKLRVHQHLSSPKAGTDQQSGKTFITHLPIVEVETGGQRIPGRVLEDGEKRVYETGENGEKVITVHFCLRDAGQGQNTLQTQPAISTSATFRYRGNSSRHFDKKSYAVHFVDENGDENPLEAAGMSRHDEWALNGPFLDRTLIRNYLCLNVAGEIMDYAPNVRYCELFRDGEYQGVYLLMEVPARGDGRIEISKPEKNRDMTSWIIRWDRTGKGDQELDNYTYYTYKSDVSSLDVRYPGKNLITDGRMEYIKSEVSRVERVLYSCDLSDPDKGYGQYLDTRAFAQYFLINEFFRNVDAGRFSTFYYKDVRGKIQPCVWDFNNACDNYADYMWDETGFTMQNAPWFAVLVRDPVFVETVISEYRRLRESFLNEKYLMNYIDETVAFLGPAVERNYQVWGYVFTAPDREGSGYLQPAWRNFDSYEESIHQLKDFIKRRGDWLDEHIEILYQYCSNSKNASRLVY